MKTPFEQPLDASYEYVVFPDEIEGAIRELDEAPELEVDVFPQYAGGRVYALTLTNPDVDVGRKQALFVSRPHAHEPAGTAACLELAKALLGSGVYAMVDPDWRAGILDRFVVTLVPDANPGGSERAPVKFWDGTEIPNERFFFWMFGESGETLGERFPRVASWDLREVTTPALLGIAYEQIEEHIYVEPNRDYRSTFFQSFFELNKRHHYDVWLDLHQTEFVNSEYNTEVHLPVGQNDLSSELQAKHRSLGKALHRRWREAGGVPREEPKESYVTNEVQRNYLNKVWLPISKRMVHLVTEVQNNNLRTPVPMQVYLQGVAILETLDWMAREAFFFYIN